MSVPDDGYLHVWECVRVLPGGDECGFISGYPRDCPYDHGDPVPLVEIVATVSCAGCRMPIIRHDCRWADGRLVCGDCAMKDPADTTPLPPRDAS